jgi:hypothetical protein
MLEVGHRGGLQFEPSLTDQYFLDPWTQSFIVGSSAEAFQGKRSLGSCSNVATLSELNLVVQLVHAIKKMC